MSERPLILVVEDEKTIGRFLSTSLTAAGYAAFLYNELEKAMQAFEEHRPALLLLDLGLPDGDGKDMIRRLRERSDIPIIVLSARQTEEEKVACFNLGADDYLAKPFGIQELLARVRVTLKRAGMMSLRDHVYDLDGLRIDSAISQVTLRNQPLHLTPIEFKLLMALARKPGKIFTHRQLLVEVWGSEYGDETHYLRIHMGRLRAKIERDPATPRFIITEPGIGYRLAAS